MSAKTITWNSVRENILADPEVKAEYELIKHCFYGECEEMTEVTLMDENQIKAAKRTLYLLLLQKPRKTGSELLILTELVKDYKVRLPVADNSINEI